MEIYKAIRLRVSQCVKQGLTEERDLLKTLVGEIQSKASRTKDGKLDDVLVAKTLKSFKENALKCTHEVIQVKNPSTSFESMSDQDAKAKREVAIYDKYLDMVPKTLTHAEIVTELFPMKGQITGAGSDGQATGIAVKYLKTLPVSADGRDVAAVVKTMRSC